MKPNYPECDTCLCYGGFCPLARKECPLYYHRNRVAGRVICAVAAIGVILMFIVL